MFLLRYVQQATLSMLQDLFASKKEAIMEGVTKWEGRFGMSLYTFEALPTDLYTPTEVLALLGGTKFFEQYGLQVRLFPAAIFLSRPDYPWNLHPCLVFNTEHVSLLIQDLRESRLASWNDIAIGIGRAALMARHPA